MKISDITSVIERYAPQSLALSFDNVGLLLGDSNNNVTRVLLTLDVDEAVVREAAALGAELIISHHPIMFEAVKKITMDTPDGRCLIALIQNGISVYSAHTNLDAASGGLCDLVAALLEIGGTVALEPDENGEGIGRVGDLDAPRSLYELAQKVKNVFGASAVRFTGEPDTMVQRVALCSGGGGSMVCDAVNAGAQVYISGDIKYNAVRDAVAQGMNIIELSHYDSEFVATELFKKIITTELGNSVEVFITTENKNIYSNIV